MMCAEHEMLDGVPDPDCEDCRREVRADLRIAGAVAENGKEEDENVD